MKEQSEKVSLKMQSVWLLGAKIIGFVFAFILPLLVVRLLTQENVGLYRQSFQVIVNAIAILPLGFSMSAYYFLNRSSEKRGAAIINILLFNFVVGGLACLLLFLFPQILGTVFQSTEMTRLAPMIGIVIWIWIFSTFLETVTIANQEAKLATVFIILAQFSKTALMAGAVVFFRTVDAFIYAAMIQGVIQTLILIYYLNSRFPAFWREFNFAFLKEQMIYAVPFGLAGILWTLQTDIHNYFVGYRFHEEEYAIYAYGCFELPLISMLAESVISVLIPRMTELQASNDTQEMIRLTARAMQKLALFYFPIYIFMLITAETFILTLFTRHYLPSASIFVINITLLPFQILLTDPIVRAYKELGRFLLVLRVFILIGLVSALFFGIWHFGLQGMIAIVVVAALIEKFIAETVIVRKLGFGRKDLPLLKNVGKTAVVALFAGVFAFVIHSVLKNYLLIVGEDVAGAMFTAPNLTVINFIGGSFTLLMTAAVFVPIFLWGTNRWGVIEEEEKQMVRNAISKLKLFFKRNAVHPTESQTLN